MESIESEFLVGVRLAAETIFCRTDNPALPEGQAVRVLFEHGSKDGRVSIPSALISAQVPLVNAPRAVAVAEPAGEEALHTAGVVLLTDAQESVTLKDVQRALYLAGLPVPEPPPERR